MAEHKQGKAHNIQRSSRNKAKRLWERQRYRTEANRKRKWAKHLADNPNDIQAKKTLKKLNPLDKGLAAKGEE